MTRAVGVPRAHVCVRAHILGIQPGGAGVIVILPTFRRCGRRGNSRGESYYKTSLLLQGHGVGNLVAKI